MYQIAQKKRFYIKITIYAILLVAIIILWFFCAGKVKSLNNFYEKDSIKLQTELSNNFSKKISESSLSAIDLGVLGENLVKKGFPNFGMIVLDKAIERDPNIRDLTLYAAAVNFQAKNIEKAKTLALNAVKIDPLYAPTFSLLGTIYDSLNDTQNAQICYNKAKDFSSIK